MKACESKSSRSQSMAWQCLDSTICESRSQNTAHQAPDPTIYRVETGYEIPSVLSTGTSNCAFEITTSISSISRCIHRTTFEITSSPHRSLLSSGAYIAPPKDITTSISSISWRIHRATAKSFSILPVPESPQPCLRCQIPL